MTTTATTHDHQRLGALLAIAALPPGSWGATAQAVSRFEDDYCYTKWDDDLGVHVVIVPDIDAELEKLWLSNPSGFHPDRDSWYRDGGSLQKDEALHDDDGQHRVLFPAGIDVRLTEIALRHHKADGHTHS